MPHKTIIKNLLNWYDVNQRILPWRKRNPDPYHVWLSEIMLQQTTVVTVIPYYQKFLQKWPTIQKLAAAPLDDILTAWAGLGYYARARNLHKCAQNITHDYNGQFPQTAPELLKLSGIGPYTSAAIAAIAFDQAAMPVDGNIERSMSRLFAITAPLPAAKAQLKTKAESFLTYHNRYGDFPQALMDLASSICTPRNPKCQTCPLSTCCQAHAKNIAADLPKRTPKKPRPHKTADIFWLQDYTSGKILLHRRPPKGLLGGMLEFPSSPWEIFNDAESISLKNAPLLQNTNFILAHPNWRPAKTSIKHIFTHFSLELRLFHSKTSFNTPSLPPNFTLIHHKNFNQHALPSLMQKVSKTMEKQL